MVGSTWMCTRWGEYAVSHHIICRHIQTSLKKISLNAQPQYETHNIHTVCIICTRYTMLPFTHSTDYITQNRKSAFERTSQRMRYNNSCRIHSARSVKTENCLFYIKYDDPVQFIIVAHLYPTIYFYDPTLWCTVGCANNGL